MKRRVRAGGALIEYNLVQAARSDVLIQALEGGLTRVYAPKHARLADVDELVRKNAEKITAMAERLKPRPLMDSDIIRVEGRPRCVTIRRGAENVELGEDNFVITSPDPDNADAVRAQALAFLSALALSRIRSRIDHFLPLTGGWVNRVTVRAQRSRWGSCSSKHNLSFNWKLILAPPGCLDYVVIHELCHLTEFNHSPRFWRLVEAQQRDYKVWKDYLKRNGAALTL